MGQVLAPVTMAEQSVIANAVESRRQDAQEKASDELCRIERHRLWLVRRAIIGIPEAHVAVAEVDQPLVGDLPSSMLRQHRQRASRA